MDKEDFVQKAVMIHGNVYNYDDVPEDIKTQSVNIKCNRHGMFKTNYSNHLKGVGCRQCKYEKKFLEEAKELHNDRYTYDDVYYVTCDKPVVIKCKIHGDFNQTPSRHLNGNGCPECFGTKKGTTEDFIEKSRKVHGDTYDYSKVDYKTKREKVIIICHIHGEFSQTASVHYTGSGCPKCNGNYTPPRDEFINEANKIHNNIYCYDNIDYINLSTPITILCPSHDTQFTTTPSMHLDGSVCKQCSTDKIRMRNCSNFITNAKEHHNNRYTYDDVKYINGYIEVSITCPEHGNFSMSPHSHLYSSGGGNCPECVPPKKINSTESFIEKSRDVHGDRYDYSKVEYIKSDIPVVIICKEHGEFLQKPSYHAGGSHCPKCVGKAPVSEAEFIERAKETHGDLYLYDNLNYINTVNKVSIGCREHGIFNQDAHQHLSGSGCPSCSSWGYSPSGIKYFYIQKLTVNTIIIGYKFGVTYNTNRRIMEQSKKSQCEHELVYEYKNDGGYIFQLESYIKKEFSGYPTLSKEMMPDGYTETIVLDDGDKKIIERVNAYIRDNPIDDKNELTPPL